MYDITTPSSVKNCDEMIKLNITYSEQNHSVRWNGTLHTCPSGFGQISERGGDFHGHRVNKSEKKDIGGLLLPFV